MIIHTFVIPAYKESAYLEECILHLLGQTVPSRIIIATSTPSLFIEKLAVKYKLDYHINDSGKNGIANDWNFALSKAETALVTLAHQDDIYEVNYAETLIKQFTGHSAGDILIAFTNYHDIVNGRIRSFSLNALIKQTMLWPFIFSRRTNKRWVKKLILLFGDPICCPSVTFNQAALTNFHFSDNYSCALDWYAWYELANRDGFFLYIPEKLVGHRIHQQSETVMQINSGQRKQEELNMFRLMWGKTWGSLIARVYALGHRDNLS